MKLKTFPRLLKRSAARWSEDHAMRLAASLAYYTAFSLAPLLLAAIAIGGLVFGHEAASGRIYAELKGALGPSVAKSIQDLVEAARKPAHGIWGAVLAFGLLLFGASGVFGELKDSLNIVWKQQGKAGSGIWTWIRGRFLSVGMVLVVCFLLLVSLVVDTALGAATEWVVSGLQIAPWVMQSVGILVSFAFVILLFALLFKYLPDAKVEWRHVWVGSIFTAILFTLGKAGLEIYLSKAAIASSYGAAGALALVLVWVYYSAQIFLLGAEFTAVRAEAESGASADKTETPADEPVTRIVIRPAPRPPQRLDPLAPAMERLTKVLAVEKPQKLKPSQHWARLAGAGLVLGAVRMFERRKGRHR